MKLENARFLEGSNGGQDLGENVIHTVCGHIEDAEAFGGILRRHYLR